MNFENSKPKFSRDSNWCSKKTKCEKRLLILCILIFLIAIALLIALIVVANQNNEYEKNVCSTPGCIHAASNLIKNIDTSQDPCDDFYNFACGKFIKDNTIPEDETVIGPFSSTSDVVRDQLKLLLEEPIRKNSSKASRLIKKLYDICMNTTAIEIDGLSTVKSTIKEVGGWPLLEGSNWNENAFDWKQTMYKFRKHGFSTNYFISIRICEDEKNSTRRVLCLGEGRYSLTREILIKGLDDKIVQAYYNYIVDIAEYFGANRAAALKEIKETVEFDIKLAKICLPKEDLRNSTALYNPMTIDALHRDYPVIPWLEYFTKVLDIPDVEITDEDIVIVSVPNYINKIDALIRQTPKRVLANHVITRLALSSVYYLNDKFRNRQQDFMKILVGSSERQARWKECTQIASGSLSLASGAAYAKRFFNMKTKEHAEEILANIQDVFIRNLETLDWMDPLTKANAIEKAETITKYIAFPHELLDDKKVEKFYSNLEINTNNFFKSSKVVSLFYKDYYNSKYREPINKTDWKDHSFPTVVNAFYNSADNSIEFPAGILQGAFFGADRPRYLNYGAIGYVMGHEITHGFDDQGRQYDQNGNLNNWWNEKTDEEFLKKAQCIIDQYGNYTVPKVEMNLNGISGQGENIADNGGMKVAYVAYIKWVEENGPEPRLPGLAYTPRQLFWISSASAWCSKERDEILKLFIASGYHSPSNFRVNGPLRNSHDFSNDFKCASGSQMNPVEKCTVW